MRTKSVYIQGEKIAIELADAGYASVVFKYGSASVSCTKTGTTWSGSVDTSSLSGTYNCALFADASAVFTARFSVAPLVSRYRSIVSSIDSAIAQWGSSASQSVTVGEINTTFKDLDSLLAAKAHYTALAEAEERGSSPAFGPRRITEVYA